jgi:hypothetical protein
VTGSPIDLVRDPRTAALAAALLLAAGLVPAAQGHRQPIPVVGAEHGTSDDGFWNQAHGMATKSGYRLVFTWDADVPVNGYAEWGFAPDQLDDVARPPGGNPDTAGIAVTDIPRDDVNRTIYYRIVDGISGKHTDVRSFPATNGWTSDASDGVHEIDLVVQIDSESLPSVTPIDVGLQDLALGMDVAAERIWDASDGYARVDDVVVTDTALSYAANVPYGGTGCAADPQANGYDVQHTVADVLVQSSLPLDSHTFAKAMEDPCRAIYMGRLGQLVVQWGGLGGGFDFVHFGQVAAHELGHYAMNLPDLYPLAGTGDCWSGVTGEPGADVDNDDEPENHDISMMHNEFGYNGARWQGSEIDRGNAITPCNYGNEPASWPILAGLYPGVPTIQELEDDPDETPYPNHDDSDHREPFGNPDGVAGSGDGYDAYVLDSEPVRSTLTHAIDSDPGGEGDGSGGSTSAQPQVQLPDRGVMP